MSIWDDDLAEEDADQVLVGVSDVSGAREATLDEDQQSDMVAGKLAALMVRRQCNQHSCLKPSTGTCDHPDHRRDVDYMRHCLEVLGLTSDYPELTESDRRAWLGGLKSNPGQ